MYINVKSLFLLVILPFLVGFIAVKNARGEVEYIQVVPGQPHYLDHAQDPSNNIAFSYGNVHYLELARMVVIDGDGIENDSYVNPPQARGNLRIEVDGQNIIRGMEYDAWWRGADQPVLNDWVLILDYSFNGAQYEVMSLWNNEQYFITFLRRAPPNDSYDPAVIWMEYVEGLGTVIVDYRYPKASG